MLVVLLIIAIVLSLGAGIATSIIASTDVKETVSRLHIVWEAVNVYFEEEGAWPSSLSALATVEKCRAILRRLPKDCMTSSSASSVTITDRYGNALVYSSSGGKGGGPQLYSKGPDGQSGAAASNQDNIYRSEQQ